MIDWWLILKIAMFLWAAVFALYWFSIISVMVFGSKAAAEDIRRNLVKYTLTCMLWPVTFLLLRIRRYRQQKKHRARAKHFQ